MMPAPRTTPLQPYSPKVPVLAGMNGCQLAVLTNAAPAKITMITTDSFTRTIALLTLADSRIPMTINTVTATVMSTAGRLNTAVIGPPAVWMIVPGAAESNAGNSTPTKSCRKLVRWPDQPTATVAAPSAYSSTRFQPMIHAKNSPRVAYP